MSNYQSRDARDRARPSGPRPPHRRHGGRSSSPIRRSCPTRCVVRSRRQSAWRWTIGQLARGAAQLQAPTAHHATHTVRVSSPGRTRLIL